eukprot:jgi/Mesen1/5042/ME000025S04444
MYSHPSLYSPNKKSTSYKDALGVLNDAPLCPVATVAEWPNDGDCLRTDLARLEGYVAVLLQLTADYMKAIRNVEGGRSARPNMAELLKVMREETRTCELTLEKEWRAFRTCTLDIIQQVQKQRAAREVHATWLYGDAVKANVVHKLAAAAQMLHALAAWAGVQLEQLHAKRLAAIMSKEDAHNHGLRTQQLVKCIQDINWDVHTISHRAATTLRTSKADFSEVALCEAHEGPVTRQLDMALHLALLEAEARRRRAELSSPPLPLHAAPLLLLEGVRLHDYVGWARQQQKHQAHLVFDHGAVHYWGDTSHEHEAVAAIVASQLSQQASARGYEDMERHIIRGSSIHATGDGQRLQVCDLGFYPQEGREGKMAGLPSVVVETAVRCESYPQLLWELGPDCWLGPATQTQVAIGVKVVMREGQVVQLLGALSRRGCGVVEELDFTDAEQPNDPNYTLSVAVDSLFHGVPRPPCFQAGDTLSIDLFLIKEELYDLTGQDTQMREFLQCLNGNKLRRMMAS